MGMGRKTARARIDLGPLSETPGHGLCRAPWFRPNDDLALAACVLLCMHACVAAIVMFYAKRRPPLDPPHITSPRLASLPFVEPRHGICRTASPACHVRNNSRLSPWTSAARRTPAVVGTGWLAAACPTWLNIACNLSEPALFPGPRRVPCLSEADAPLPNPQHLAKSLTIWPSLP